MLRVDLLGMEAWIGVHNLHKCLTIISITSPIVCLSLVLQERIAHLKVMTTLTMLVDINRINVKLSSMQLSISQIEHKLIDAHTSEQDLLILHLDFQSLLHFLQKWIGL